MCVPSRCGLLLSAACSSVPAEIGESGRYPAAAIGRFAATDAARLHGSTRAFQALGDAVNWKRVVGFSIILELLADLTGLPQGM